MLFPEDLRYSAEHEWVRANGARAEVGITDFAQDSLGDIVFVEVPEVGTTLARNATCAVIDSTVNSDPYGAGWIFRLEMSDPGELDSLMDAAAYQALVG